MGQEDWLGELIGRVDWEGWLGGFGKIVSLESWLECWLGGLFRIILDQCQKVSETAPRANIQSIGTYGTRLILQNLVFALEC